MFIRKLKAFLKKDFLIFKSYKLLFLLNWGGIISTTVTFYFVSKLFGENMNPYISKYGTGYFPFVIVGIAFSSYLYSSISSFSDNIRTEQLTGTLEMLLLTPTRIRELIIGMSLWDFVFASSRAIGCLLIGILFFGLDISNINIIGSILVLLLTIICFSSVGIISGSIVIFFKKGTPVSWFIGAFSSFFGGAYFPVEILPLPLKSLSYLLPITYSLRALRSTILKGSSIFEVGGDVLALLIYAIILAPIAVTVFKISLRLTKKSGTLAYY